MRACFIAVSMVLAASACGRPEPPAFPQGEIVDLSHTYDAQTIYWPTAEGFRLRKDAEGVTPAGYYYAANSLFTSEHGGTHIDAPIHFAQGHQTVDAIPLESSDWHRRRHRRHRTERVERRLSGDDRGRRALRARARRDPRRCDRAHSDRLLTTMAGCGAVSGNGHPRRGRREATRISLGCIPMPRDGSSPTGESARSASTLPASTTASPRCSSRIVSSTSATCPLSRTSPRSSVCPSPARTSIALPMKIGGGSGAPLRAVAILPPTQIAHVPGRPRFVTLAGNRNAR